MSEDKELVEVWRAAFESQFDDDLFARGISGAYINHHRNSMWQGFLMAKRSHPSVVLPKPEVCFGNKPFAYVLLDPLCEQLTAAGIKYTIGE